jgi:hypothetical protein
MDDELTELTPEEAQYVEEVVQLQKELLADSVMNAPDAGTIPMPEGVNLSDYL